MSVAKKIVLSVGFLVVMFGAYGFYANHSGSTLNENTVSVFKWHVHPRFSPFPDPRVRRLRL